MRSFEQGPDFDPPFGLAFAPLGSSLLELLTILSNDEIHQVLDIVEGAQVPVDTGSSEVFNWRFLSSEEIDNCFGAQFWS